MACDWYEGRLGRGGFFGDRGGFASLVIVVGLFCGIFFADFFEAYERVDCEKACRSGEKVRRGRVSCGDESLVQGVKEDVGYGPSRRRKEAEHSEAEQPREKAAMIF